jgi:putative endonuclease
MNDEGPQNSYCVYVLKSKSTGRYYIGQTKNLDRRLEDHNSGKSIYTRNKGPWELVGKFSCSNRSESFRLETKLKKMKRSDRVLSYLERIGDTV